MILELILKRKNVSKIIWIVSILIPVIVAMLLLIPGGVMGNINVSFLPHLNGILNTLTTLSLLLGFYFIKVKKNANLHRRSMLTAFVLSCIFLVSYVVYHLQTEPTVYPSNSLKPLYLFILITHILLAIVVVPLVLFSIYYATSNNFVKHLKIVRFAYPIWLYVAITGVLVYLMISPYYGK